eukprot:SAG31_NODE_18334_length_640_cov_0.767098_2_plen_118_part_01
MSYSVRAFLDPRTERLVASKGRPGDPERLSVAFDFTLTPSSVMPKNCQKRDQPEKTFLQYYRDKYSVEIKDLEQPLMATTLRGRVIHLIPELCVTTDIDSGTREALPRVCAKKPRRIL